MLSEAKVSFARWSNNDLTDQSVFLADTMGEMLTFFDVAHCAFIGESLIDRGGHYPLEPAALAVPVIIGPSHYNFKHVFPQLITKQACTEVDSPSSLCNQLTLYTRSPEQTKCEGKEAFKIVESNCGAIEKTINIRAPYLSNQP